MSSKKASSARSEPIALCYVRLSWTREGDDSQSPDRQRANILRKCQAEGWTPMWFEDVDGHKSGREVKNRPGWQALTAHLYHPQVVAVVANDLSRLHRKGWRIGKLIDTLESLGIALVTAAPGKEIDTATSMGKFIINLTATFDEQYADDIADKVVDGIRHRKSKGKSAGRPPFGTKRNAQGYLIPNEDGAWWLREGRFVRGDPDTPPEAGAVWHSYYESTRQVLTRFAQGDIGLERLAYEMNAEGYPFRDNRGQPRRMNRDDIRRILGNWPEYGGLVLETPAKYRSAHDSLEHAGYTIELERAVFPVDLLYQVSVVRARRTTRPVDRGHKRTSHPYPLSYITRCAHCEAAVKREDNVALRTYFNGAKSSSGVRRYRHKAGIQCGCQNRSVPCEAVEGAFTRLLHGLTLHPTALESLVALAPQIPAEDEPDTPDPGVERQRQIERIHKKIRNIKTLFAEGHIELDEFRQRLAENERELAHWQHFASRQEETRLELATCLNAIEDMVAVWDSAEPLERQRMARNLFEYIVYDLDKQRIVDFRLKPWADKFLVLRAALYTEGRNKNVPVQNNQVRNMLLMGLEPMSSP